MDIEGAASVDSIVLRPEAPLQKWPMGLLLGCYLGVGLSGFVAISFKVASKALLHPLGWPFIGVAGGLAGFFAVYLSMTTLFVAIEKSPQPRLVRTYKLFGRVQTNSRRDLDGMAWAQVAIHSGGRSVSLWVEVGRDMPHKRVDVLTLNEVSKDQVAAAKDHCANIARFLALQDRGFPEEGKYPWIE